MHSTLAIRSHDEERQRVGPFRAQRKEEEDFILKKKKSAERLRKIGEEERKRTEGAILG